MNDRRALEIRSLTKRYGDTVAVQDLSFAVPHGSVTGFLGPNGAGSPRRCGSSSGSPRRRRARRSCWVAVRRARATARTRRSSLELTGFHPGRTARNHLLVVAIQGGLGTGGVDRALEATGMTTFASGRVGKFSLGMKQRLALSAALLGEPEVLVLDEPANGLDPAGVAWLRSFLRSFASNGGAVLVSSHILSEVAEVADGVVVIDHGRMVHEGPTGDLTAGGSVVIVRSPDAARLRPALEADGATVTDAEGALEVAGLSIERVGELAARDGLDPARAADARPHARAGVPLPHRAAGRPRRSAGAPRGAPEERPAVITLVRAEVLKLRTTRLWIVLLGVSVAVVGLDRRRGPGLRPGGDPEARALHDLNTVADVRMLLSIGGSPRRWRLVLGATMTTSEYRYGTVGITYLATPRRPRVVTAKMFAAVPVGALFGLVGASVPVLVALVWFATKGRSVPLDGTIPSSLQIGLQALFAAVMGVAVGAMLRNQVAAIVGLLVWVLVVESIVSGLIPVTAKWLPFSGAAGAFSSQASDRLFGRPGAGLLMAAYVVLGWAAAAWFERHRDVLSRQLG